MNRRAFFRLLAAASAGEVGRRYFDMGASWRKAESGLIVMRPGFMFHPSAFALVMTDLCEPPRFDVLSGWGHLQGQPLRMSQLLDPDRFGA